MGASSRERYPQACLWPTSLRQYYYPANLSWGLAMLAVYVDESCADGRNRYLIHGALFLCGQQIGDLRAAIEATVAAGGLSDEVKWSGITRAKRARELAIADQYFDGTNDQELAAGRWFQSMVIDQHQLDVRGYHGGDRDVCFYKCLYNLLVKRIAQYALPDEDVHVVLDQRTTLRYDLEDLRAVLNNALRRDLADRPPHVRTVIYRDSRTCRLLQLSDLLTGAVGFHQNRMHLVPTASPHKRAVAEHIARRANLESLQIANSWSPHMGIWTLRMGERRT